MVASFGLSEEEAFELGTALQNLEGKAPYAVLAQLFYNLAEDEETIIFFLRKET